MTEKDAQVTQTPQPRDHQRSLKQKIHDNEERLSVAEGPQEAVRLYEALFGDWRMWIKSEGTDDEKNIMKNIISDFYRAKREEVIESPSSYNYRPVMIYSIENIAATEVRTYLETAQETKTEMVSLTWRRLEEKRCSQYQKLKEIFGHKYKSDEIIHDIRETPGTVRDRIRARRDRNEDMD